MHSIAPKAAKAAELVDGFGREITYLRVSVTDRCNLRCTYCMAEDMEFLPRQQVLSLEEIEFIGRTFVSMGVSKIRLTGGEPLIRKNVLHLVENLASLPGLREVVMTTNGILLGKYAHPLANAGLKRLNISIDSLREDRFAQLTRVGELEDVLTGIETARSAGFKSIKLNCVVMKGVNDDEVCDLTRFAVERGLDIAFIEEMPLGTITSHNRVETSMSNDEVLARVGERFTLTPSAETTGGPARYYKIPDSDTRVGLISPHSHNFCGDCNRVRLTVEGRLLLCLGNEHSADLKSVVRRNPGDEEALRRAIVAALPLKPERHYFDPAEERIVRFMNTTGG